MSRYLLQSVSKAQTKRGKPYLRMTMYEPGGKLWPAVFWEDRDFKSGQIVDALVEESAYNGTPQLEVKAMRMLAEKAEDDEFLPRAKVDAGGLLKELTDYVNSVSLPPIKLLLLNIIADPRWARGPAAMSKHHAYLGGLLVHTVGLCRLADAVAKLYPNLRRDLLIFGAVAHDFGKLDELTYESNIDYSDEGKLEGHIVIGLLKIEKFMDEMGVKATVYDPAAQVKMPDNLRILLRHMVLSHHGNKAYGSPVTPQLPEAVAFSAMDGLDASMASVAAAVENAGNNSWTERTSTGESMFVGKI